MIYKHDYANSCWWCGSTAESGEHKFKKTDLIRYFGRGPYRGNESIVRGVGGKLRNVRGPNSGEVRFENILCSSCNNAKSQPFDRSYDRFVEYIHDHEENILAEKKLCFPDIYGEEWQSDVGMLYRYIVKHICCRLAQAKIRIHPNIIAFLNDKGPLQHLRLAFEIREDILAMEKKNNDIGLDNGSFWMGDLMYMKSQSTGSMSEANSFLGFRWLRINYIYDEDISYPKNIEWLKIIELPSGYNIDPKSI